MASRRQNNSLHKTCVMFRIVRTKLSYSLLSQFLQEYMTRPVADLEGVPWVPWNPSFEGLPLRILSKSVQK